MVGEKFEINQTVYCVDEEAYSNHIRKRNKYTVQEIGIGSKEGKIRIKNDSGKLVWISDLHFVSNQIPKIKQITIDDEVKDIENDCIEVTVLFDNEDRIYLIFMTAKYLLNSFSQFRKYRIGSGIIFVKMLTQELIEETIIDLDLKNKLISNSKEY